MILNSNFDGKHSLVDQVQKNLGFISKVESMVNKKPLMSMDKLSISNAVSYQEIGKFWDKHAAVSQQAYFHGEFLGNILHVQIDLDHAFLWKQSKIAK